MGWLKAAIDAALAAAVPPLAQQASSFRVRESSQIDVRNVPQPAFTWAPTTVSLVSHWAPIEQELRSFRAREPDKVDVRNIPQPFYNVDADMASAFMAPITQQLLSFRARDRIKVDVRNIRQPFFNDDAFRGLHLRIAGGSMGLTFLITAHPVLTLSINTGPLELTFGMALETASDGGGLVLGQ
jgi:hypothetical protein